jgi:two-component system, chemotaxis family, CheB/CheR fusion protein
MKPAPMKPRAEPAPRPADEPARRPANEPVPVVGIGASAGGLAAFEAFFSGMPADADPGMAFVLVQHLAPDRKSALVDLVGRYTRMEVFEVEDGMVVRPSCVYIIPPGRDLAYASGALHLARPQEPRGARLPIDTFLRSLALGLGDRAIGIVLSGTGKDGTQGIRAIADAGGLTIAQSLDTAEYDSMPRSAIEDGSIDEIMAPSDMFRRVVAHVTQALVEDPRLDSMGDATREAVVREILALVRAETGHDFAGYKRSTINRRIERRMAFRHENALDSYVDYMRRTPEEADALCQDLLIGVTSFFRDPEAFAVLQELAIAKIVARHGPGGAIRAWVPGCATGEEAYSIAILFQEEMEAQKRFSAVQVFGTDIDARSIKQARSGAYPPDIAASITPERLARYFVVQPERSGYRVHQTLRDMVLFSEQDVVRDPPFSRLDLLSCRNLLIYMRAELQAGLLSRFHHALVPEGFLFLGNAEAIGRNDHLFGPVDRAAKLFERRHAPAGTPPSTRASALVTSSRSRFGAHVPGDLAPAGDGLQQLTERALLAATPRAAVLITAAGAILYVHGRTGQYLEPAEGAADFNVLRMARPGLRRELVTAVRQVLAHDQPVSRGGLRIKGRGNDEDVYVTLEVRRVDPEATPDRPLYLVLLEEAAEATPAGRAAPGVAGGAGAEAGAEADADPRVAVLERELQVSEAEARAAVEQFETSITELSSFNEELESLNEELTSVNEKLETSTEELQSVNEELITINAELQATVTDLTRANSDIDNLMSGTGVATVFVDLALRIRLFTPGATAVLNLLATDVGRPLGHVVSNLVGYSRLEEDARAVLDDLVPFEVEVEDRAGAWYLLAIRPYRTLGGVVDGVVLTFTDTSEMRKATALAQGADDARRLAAVVHDARDAIVVQDLEGRILAWNRAATRMFGWSESEALAMNARDLLAAADREAALVRVIELGRGDILAPLELEWRAKDGRILAVWLVATALLDAEGAMYAVSTTVRERVVAGPVEPDSTAPAHEEDADA